MCNIALRITITTGIHTKHVIWDIPNVSMRYDNIHYNITKSDNYGFFQSI